MTSCQIVVTLKQTRNQINLPSLTGNYWNTESLQLFVRSIFLKYISMVQYLFKALSALDDEISRPPNRKEGRRWLIIKETTRHLKATDLHIVGESMKDCRGTIIMECGYQLLLLLFVTKIYFSIIIVITTAFSFPCYVSHRYESSVPIFNPDRALKILRMIGTVL